MTTEEEESRRVQMILDKDQQGPAWEVSRGRHRWPSAGTEVYRLPGQDLSNFKKAGEK